MTPFAVLFAASLAVPAQSAPVDPLGGSSLATSKAMAEDVETMRYILARKLAPFASGGGTWTGTLWGVQSTAAPMAGLAAQGYAPSSANAVAEYYSGQSSIGRGHVAAIEGLYLPRVGVLFTVTLPPTKGDPRMKADAASKSEPFSEWERAKLAIEGKAPPATPPAARRETPLAEVLLKALADNGKHFRELRDDERILVVATFRKSADGGDPNAASALELYTAVAAPRAALNIAPPAPGQPPRGMPGQAGVGSDADYDAVAELHLKRGNYAEAIEAFAAAAKKAVKELETADDAGQAEALKRARAAFAKLGQAHMAAGQFDRAKAVLESASRLNEKGHGSTPAATKPTAPPLPARLTVSATKRDLVAAAAGKMTFEELGKAATVEFSDPAATATK